VTLLAGSPNRRHASQAAGFAAVMVAAAALVGWWAEMPQLSGWGSGLVTVKPVTALCVAALGLTLVHPGKNLRLAFAVGLAVAVVTTLDLLGVDFGINGWLVPQVAVSGPETVSFRMMNGMPLALAFAGGALALSRFERHRFAATALGGVAALMAVFALLTYVTGIHRLYSSVMPPALPTASACFVSPSRLFCGSERRPRSTNPGRCANCRSCSDARSLPRFCCLARTRARGSPMRSSATFAMT